MLVSFVWHGSQYSVSDLTSYVNVNTYTWVLLSGGVIIAVLQTLFYTLISYILTFFIQIYRIIAVKEIRH